MGLDGESLKFYVICSEAFLFVDKPLSRLKVLISHHPPIKLKRLGRCYSISVLEIYHLLESIRNGSLWPL